MSVDTKATEDMASLMRMLSETSGAVTASVAPVGMGADMVSYDYDAADVYDPNDIPMASHLDDRPPVNVSSGEVDLMKSVLEAFNAAQANATVRAAEDPELREAMVTTRTSRGARIGSWEILENDGKIKTYDIVAEGTELAIAKDLYLYDAAYGIAKALNEGAVINSTRVRSLLRLESDFAKNRDDASAFKARAKKLREQGETRKAAVAEDRLDEAARQAKMAHEEILRLAGVRR